MNLKKNNVKTFLSENWLIVIVLVYLLLPIDIIPDSIPLIGNLDDATLLVIELIRKYVKYRKEKSITSQ